MMHSFEYYKDNVPIVQVAEALGYEFKQFYVGATASTILRSFKYKNFNVDLGTEQFRITVGKRFDVNRKNR